MRHRGEDATVWIGYSDFMTTLAILFFTIAVAIAARTGRGPARLEGTVTEAVSGLRLSDCLVRLGLGRDTRTDPDGHFSFVVTELAEPAGVDVTVSCADHGTARVGTVLSPGRRTDLDVKLVRDIDDPNTIRVRRIAGDLAFRPADFRLTDEGVAAIRRIGEEFKANLRTGEVIAVQGHTDDVPFADGSGKDNWILSGERASSAARVLTDPSQGIGIPECRVIIMGFGPSRPLEPLSASDPAPRRAEKRAKNRRIEFRILRGQELAGGSC